jgi:hypothetical protein
VRGLDVPAVQGLHHVEVDSQQGSTVSAQARISLQAAPEQLQFGTPWPFALPRHAIIATEPSLRRIGRGYAMR